MRLAWSASAVSVRLRSIPRTVMASASCSAISSTRPTSARLKYPRAGSRARVSTPCVCSLSATGTLSSDEVPSRASSGTPPGPAPRMSLSSACVTSSVLPDSRTWRRQRPRLRVHRRYRLRQRPGLVLIRPGDVVAPEQPAPVHVHDHPRAQRLGQQPGAPLQGDGLAERDVLQQQPAGRGGQVQPPGHHRHHGIGRAWPSQGKGSRAGRRAPGPRRRPLPGRDQQPVVPAAHADRPHVQHAADPAPGRQQLAVQLPAALGAGGRGQQRTDRRPPGRFDERAERLPGRIAAGRPEQRARGRVGAAHGAVLAQHEQRPPAPPGTRRAAGGARRARSPPPAHPWPPRGAGPAPCPARRSRRPARPGPRRAAAEGPPRASWRSAAGPRGGRAAPPRRRRAAGGQGRLARYEPNLRG